MRIATACQICGQRLVKFVCSICGANVCENCYDKTSGKCINCKLGKRIKKVKIEKWRNENAIKRTTRRSFC